MTIREDETAGELHDDLMKTGAALLLKTVQAIAAGNIQETPQANIPADAIKHAPKIFKETCQINWQQPLNNIYNLVRGLSPYPAAWTVFQGKTLKIYKAHKESTTPSKTPGDFDTDQKTYVKIAAPDGYLYLDEVQLEGKKKMDIEAFLRGYRF